MLIDFYFGKDKRLAVVPDKTKKEEVVEIL